MSSVRALPLALRLPNPPALFYGRHTESEVLAAAIERGPVAGVWGLGGVGKTALVLHTLKRRFADRTARTILVSLRPSELAPAAHVEVLRAVADACRLRLAWSELGDEPAGAVAVALDAAEQAGLWVVIDDLHHAAPASGAALMRELARYARTSRWIFTSRINPAIDELGGQVLQLGVLDDAALTELVRGCAPALSPADVAAAVQRAAGSPSLLRQRLVEGRSATEPAVAATLPPRQRALLELLTGVDDALPSAELCRLAALAEDDLVELERHAFLERTGDGYRLHDSARALLGATTDAIEAARRAAAILADSAHPAAALAAVQALVRCHGDAHRVRELLDRHGEGWLSEGRAPLLARLLEPASEPQLAGWRLRLAVELGAAAGLERVSLPPEALPADRLQWARALALRGRLDEAAQQAAAVCLAAGGERGLALAAGAVALEAVGLGGATADEAALVAALERVSPATAAESARRDAHLARWYAARGHYPRALELLERTGAGLPQLDAGVRREVGGQLLVALVGLGRIKQAEAVAAQLLDGGGEQLDLVSARQAMLMMAGVATVGGRLQLARSLLDRIAPEVHRFPTQKPAFDCISIYYRFCAGELSGLSARIDELLALAETGRLPLFRQWAEVLRVRLARLHGRELEQAAPTRSGALADQIELAALHLRSSRGEALTDAAGLADRFPPGVDLRVMAHLVAAQDAALGGKWPAARQAVARAIQEAVELGHRLLEAQARRGRCGILLVSGGAEELGVAVDELAELAASFPSAGFAAEADFFRVVGATIPDPVALERLATLGEVSPPVARRARGLLGAALLLDAVDRSVVTAAMARDGGWSIVTLGDRAWRPGWGIDEHRHAVWCGDRSIDLGASPLLWRFLVAIADAGGRADRETLVPAVWSGEAYDPERHNDRLYTTVNKLRRLIEDDPAAPTRLVTSSEVYGFGGDEAFRRLRRTA